MDSHILLTALGFILSIIFLFTRRSPSSKSLRLPPGPPGYPVVGNLLQVALSGKPFFQYVRDLIPIYGPILTLRMGGTTMIIISSADLAREALIEKGQVFASRPRENPTRTIFSCNKFTVNAAVYGNLWRTLRRNMVQNMLSAQRLREFRWAREHAMEKLIRRLRAEAAANDGRVWVLKNARFAVFYILLCMCFGVDLDEETIERVEEMMKTVLMVLDPGLDDYLPLLTPFFHGKRKRVHQVRKQQIETLTPLIEKRRGDLQGKDAASFSYLDTLFDLKIDGPDRTRSPSNEEIVTLCSELLNGGTDTTATAIEWAIARLVENPAIQTRLYEEIRSAVGDRRVEDKDVETLPYLSAVVKELLRKHPPTYFSLTHAVVEPTRLAGYDIPADTNVEFFLQGIGEDRKKWSDPDRFDPDRFYTGREDADITGVSGVRMIPFGMGRRICPGLGMATLHVNLMLARMVQEFEWAGSDGDDEKMDFTGKVEFTIVMKNSLRAQIKPRLG